MVDLGAYHLRIQVQSLKIHHPLFYLFVPHLLCKSMCIILLELR